MGKLGWLALAFHLLTVLHAAWIGNWWLVGAIGVAWVLVGIPLLRGYVVRRQRERAEAYLHSTLGPERCAEANGYRMRVLVHTDGIVGEVRQLQHAGAYGQLHSVEVFPTMEFGLFAGDPIPKIERLITHFYDTAEEFP